MAYGNYGKSMGKKSSGMKGSKGKGMDNKSSDSMGTGKVSKTSSTGGTKSSGVGRKVSW